MCGEFLISRISAAKGIGACPCTDDGGGLAILFSYGFVGMSDRLINLWPSSYPYSG